MRLRRGRGRGAYERLAENTGGAYFHVKKLDMKPADLAKLIYANVRGSYELTVSGVYTLGSKIKVEIVDPPSDVKKSPVATALVLEYARPPRSGRTTRAPSPAEPT
ncbi:MAG: hypothetical protein R2748_06305 [Bryobacterales bacterium]